MGEVSGALAALRTAAAAPLHEWPARYPGRRAAGVLCSDVPDEIIHAAGFCPVRLRATGAPLRCVDAHLQSFTCALCRSTLDQFLGGEFQFLTGTVFAHSCDAMQSLADLWRINAPAGYRLEVVMQPTRVGAEDRAARQYLAAELRRFRDRLAGWAEEPAAIAGDDALRASIALYDETRRMVGELQARRDRLAAADFYAVLDAALRMPREEFNRLLAVLVAELDGMAARPAGPRLFLSGAVLDEPDLLDLIDELGAQVAGDDLCSGSRHFHGRVGGVPDPIDALADCTLRRPPCPARYRPGYDPGRALLEQVRAAQGRGVVFVLNKYCDPHAFQRALVLPVLDQAGVPHLLLEMDHRPSLEALRTRLQAFIEMVQPGIDDGP